MICKTINVKNRLSEKDKGKIKNSYFNTLNNEQNLSFILKICSKLGIKKNIIFGSQKLIPEIIEILGGNWKIK